MRSTNTLHNDKQHINNRYNCCSYCCCYNNHPPPPSPQQHQHATIPPWTPSTNYSSNNTLTPLSMDSICSCCSCISSIETAEDDSNNRKIENVLAKKEADEEEEEESTSTGRTTPVESKVLREEENSSLENIEKLKKKKIHAIKELLQTERDYVQDLCYLIEICLEVLNRQTWITQEHKSIITRNSIEILKFHKQFIISIDSTSLSDNDNWSSIAKAFIDQIDQFSLYKHYCDMHAEAWTLTSEYRDRPEWNQCFLKECTVLDSHSIPLNLNHLLLDNNNTNLTQLQQQQQSYAQPKKLHFEDYLIKPVQRICRYQLLIKEIIRYTSSHTSEYDLWSIVLKEMQDIVTEIDDLKFQRDMKERTDRFITRLDGDWRINKRHVSQLGSLLIAGAIEITYSALGQSVSKPRYLGCFIFQTYIIMVRPKKVTSYEPKHWFPLRMTEFEDLMDIEGQREHSFVLRCKKHAFAFSASCSQEKQLWVKKIQEAIVAAKIEASDESLSAQDFIVSSLLGITSRRSPQSIRLSKSFTNLLDMTLTANNMDSIIDNNKKSVSSINANSAAENRKLLRRSASTSIQFEDIIRITKQQAPSLPTSSSFMIKTTTTNPSTVSLKKRYSADYSAFATRQQQQQQQQQQLGLKPRNNSEMYIKPDSFAGGGLANTRRRPSSLDLLSAANNTSNMIGKMSLQLKSNHQNALRVTVDHKLRDVCTQDYLSSRAWYIRDRDAGTSSPSPIDSITSSCQVFTSGSNSNGDMLKKRKSTSFIRPSASGFSIMIPKRTSDSSAAAPKPSPFTRYHSEYDLQSNTSSCSSSIDRSASPVNNSNHVSGGSTSRRPSQSSQLLRRISQQNRNCLSESPVSFDSESGSSTASCTFEPTTPNRLERIPSKKQLFVGKVLRRIASLHQRSPPSPSPSPSTSYFDSPLISPSSIYSDEAKKAPSFSNSNHMTKHGRMKWRRQHEDMVQLQASDRHHPPASSSATTMTVTSAAAVDTRWRETKEEEVEKKEMKNETTANITTHHISESAPTIISAFAYASTPPIPRQRSSFDIHSSGRKKWKNRLSMIRPASFLRISSTTSTD